MNFTIDDLKKIIDNYISEGQGQLLVCINTMGQNLAVRYVEIDNWDKNDSTQVLVIGR